MTQGKYSASAAVPDSHASPEEELLEIEIACTAGQPLGIEFLFGQLNLPRGPTRGLFVRRVDKQLAAAGGGGEAGLLEEGDFVLSANGQELRTATTEAAALATIRRAARQACRLRILRSDFVRSEFLNCLVRSLNGGSSGAGAGRLQDAGYRLRPERVPQSERRAQQYPRAFDAPESSPTRPSQQPPQPQQQQPMSALPAEAQVPLSKLEAALARLGYRFSSSGLAELRAAVGGGGGGGGGSAKSVPFGQFVAAVNGIIGRRRAAAGAVAVEEPLIAATTSATSAAAAPPRRRQANGSGSRDQLDVAAAAAAAAETGPVAKATLSNAAKRPSVSTVATQTPSSRTADAEQAAAAAAAAAAKSESRELADRCAALQRRLDDAESANERDCRRLAVLAGELRKAGRHSNRLATALQAALDLLGRLANLDEAERAEADAVVERIAALLGDDSVPDNDERLPSGWESAAAVERRQGDENAEAAGVVYVNHAEGRVAAEAPMPPATERSPMSAVAASADEDVDGPKRLQRYRMDILDRNGVPVRQIAL